MDRLNRIKLIYYLLIPAIIITGLFVIFRLTNDRTDILNIGGQDIYFTYTDDNSGEDLIIKSNQKNYSGFNGNEVYFSINNTRRKSEFVDLQVHFDNDQASVADIAQWDRVRNDWVSLADVPFALTDSDSDLVLKKKTEYLAGSKQTSYFKMAINYPPLSQGEFYIEAIGQKGGYGLLDPWYNSSWLYRKKITIDYNQVDSTETGFPILATTTDTDLRDKAQSDGDDIFFTSSDGIMKIPHEIEKYDNSTGQLVAWVKADISSTTDTVLYMYYGNSDTSDQQEAVSVWDNNNKGVWHLSETSGTSTDSTQYGNDAGIVGSVNKDPTYNYIDGADGFNEAGGDTDNLRILYDSSLNITAELTLQAWVRTTNVTKSDQRVVQKRWGTGLVTYALFVDVGTIEFVVSPDGSNYDNCNCSSVTSGEWTHLAVTFDDGASPEVRVYKNGTEVCSDSLIYSIGTNTEINEIGGVENRAARGFEGQIDEVRISDVARSAQWIATEYNNQQAVSEFLIFGSEESFTGVTKVNTPQTNKLTSGLVGHWTFDGQDMNWASTTAEALDRSGQGNNGNVIGPTATIGKAGQGLEFDGSDDYVEVPRDASLEPNTLTVSFWAKASTWQSGGSEYYFLAKGGYQSEGYELFYNNPLIYWESNASGSYDYLEISLPSAGVWHHYAFTYDNRYKEAYIDGGFINSKTASFDMTYGTNEKLYIAQRSSGDNIDAIIDEVRIYNRALSADEIAELYRAGARKLQPNTPLANTSKDGSLVGHWTFDGGDMNWASTTAEALDRSGQGNNGNVIGPTTVIGKVGQGLNFDGTDDYVDIPDANSLDATNITLAAWVKSDTADRYIIAKDPPGPIPEKSEAVDPQFNNLEELKIKEVESEKYAFKTLDGGLIEIGEERHSPPQPYLKLNKWDDEVTLKVDIPYGKDGEKSLVQNILKWINDKYEVAFYPREPEEIEENGHRFTLNEEGGVEFDVILKEKPASNVFEFPIETEGLEFYYQPPLHPEHPTWADRNGDGQPDSFRPENAVGSYAVYHATKQGDYTALGGKNYRAGKAFHIYRPKVKDAQGKEIWGELNVDPIGKSLISNGAGEKKGLLTITVDQDWLDDAVYPVTIDPNFGYETIGGSNDFYVSANDMLGSLFTSPANAGSANSFTAYGYWGNGNYAKAVLVLHSNLNILSNGVGDPVVGFSTSNWHTSSFATSPSLSPSTEYVLMLIGDSNTWLYYDSGDTNQGHVDTSNSYSSPTNPTDASHNNNKFSIYCSYNLIKTVPYALSTKNNGEFEVVSGGTTYTASSTTNINDSSWHYLVGTYDGSSMKMYVDGVLEDTNTDLSGDLPTNTGNVRIGADYSTTPANFFSGLIDEARIYNRALSASEITDLYRAGARRLKF